MVKSLCKYRRAEIADQFATITKIVSEPKFICASCTRVASDKDYLCKPSRLTNATSAAPIMAPILTPVITLAASAPPAPVMMNVRSFPMPTAVGQRHIEMVTVVEQTEVIEQPDALLEQTKKLKKFDKQLRKTQQALALA